MRSRSNRSIRKIISAVIFISCETNEIKLFNQRWVCKSIRKGKSDILSCDAYLLLLLSPTPPLNQINVHFSRCDLT